MTTVYAVSRDQIITAALRKLGVVDLGTTLDADTVTNSAQALNIMVKAWQSQGIKLWTIQEYTLPLVANQKTYTIGPTGTVADLVAEKPLKVIQAFSRNLSVTPNIDIPLQPLSRQEYNMLGSKSSTGLPNSWWYTPGTTTGSLTLFLTPDALVAANYEVHLVAQQPIADITLSTDIPSFPNEWMQALVWGLADELAIEYSVPGNHRQEITAKAMKYRSELEDWDVETNSSFFTPDTRMARG